MSGSYVVLARKYRPQTFEDVVGQNAVSQTLLNAVEAGRVAHAYVFSGPRGVGKTTTARILAKCLNCEKGPTKTPCNKCDACISISQSNSTDDVMEIDGASNRGIEQIRELRESAKYAPARSRYRIYIIDEAHQITKDAFGALLKTLEEPPPHVVFMMATTEVQKIPAPILSRCQRFSLRPISAELVFKHLKEICKAEKIKVEDEALADIVRFVEGSLRDALSLLDQAIVFSPKGINPNTIRDLLGLLPLEMIRDFAKEILAGEPAAILKKINEAVQSGIDLTQLGKDLQNYYHNLLLTKAGVEDAFKVNSLDLNKEAASFDFMTLERNIRLLSKALEDMRHSETPRAIFEVHALRLGQKTVDAKVLVERLEKLEKNGPAAAPAPVSAPSFRAPVASAPVIRTAFVEKQIPSPASGEGRVRAVIAPTSSNPHPDPLPDTGRGSTPSSAAAVPFSLDEWTNFIAEVSHVRVSLASALEGAEVTQNGDRLTLIFDKTFNQDMVTRAIEPIKEIFIKRFGAWMPFDMKTQLRPANTGGSAGQASADKPNSLSAPRTASGKPSPLEEANQLEDVAPGELTSNVKDVLKHFPGTVKREKK